MRRIAATLLVAILVAACSVGATDHGPMSPAGAGVVTLPPSPVPSGGLTEVQAFAAARVAFPEATGVVSGTVGQLRDFSPDQRAVPGDRWVWAVVVSGSFNFSCGPSVPPPQTHPPCPSPATTGTVVLDYTTGAFIEAIIEGDRSPTPVPAPTSTSVPSMALSSRSIVVDDPFRLAFELPKTTWTAGETIRGLATLSVVGRKGLDLGGSGSGLFGFEFADVAGTHDIQPGWTADCGPYRLDPGKPITSALRKSGGFSADQPDASFARAFLTDPVITLPAGDWQITAVANFIEKKDCSGQQHMMRATVIVHVTP